MFGWIIVTGKKILASLFLVLLLYFLSPSLNLGPSESILLIYALLIGMAFPDIDIITGLFKYALHSVAVFIFLFALVIAALYPASIQVSGEMCSEELLSTVFGISGFGTYCNAGSALIFMALCYMVARSVVGWIPDKNMLHSYFTALLVIVCAALFLKFGFEPRLFIPMLISFSTGYFMHLAIDAGYHHANK